MQDSPLTEEVTNLPHWSQIKGTFKLTYSGCIKQMCIPTKTEALTVLSKQEFIQILDWPMYGHLCITP